MQEIWPPHMMPRASLLRVPNHSWHAYEDPAGIIIEHRELVAADDQVPVVVYLPATNTWAHAERLAGLMRREMDDVGKPTKEQGSST